MRTRKVLLVDLRGQHKIALRQAADFVGVDLNVHFPPGQAQIGMMAFRFRDGADAVHEIERGFEIGKEEALRDVMLLDDLPLRQLLGVGQQLLALERLHASAARDAVLIG